MKRHYRLMLWWSLGIFMALILLLPPPSWSGARPSNWPEPELKDWTWNEDMFWQKKMGAYTFVLPRSAQEVGQNQGAQTVIGTLKPYTVRRMDTVLDIARYFGLGYNEIAAVYPGIDPWVPPVGAQWMLPTSWILPYGQYEGVVVNIPEMRLYYFPAQIEKNAVRTVITAPVGIGRVTWQTPRAHFSVIGKTTNPTWVIPESIRQERIEMKGWSERSIPGGAPNNPLGKYRIELTLPSYRIHDTNNPWTIGRLTTHGCVRLYPEDITQFFDVVRVGTRGAFVYQPVKLGLRDGRVYVEVHEDIYQFFPDLQDEAYRIVRESGSEALVDPLLLGKAVQAQSGVPTDVTRGHQIQDPNEITAVEFN
jgi:L,D-transpeptidase ErfK/SrfK